MLWLYIRPEWVKWEVAQSYPTLCDPMDCSLPGSSVHGIFQERILEWVAISFSRGSFRPRDQTRVSHIVGRRFTVWATREVRIGSYTAGKNKKGTKDNLIAHFVKNPPVMQETWVWSLGWENPLEKGKAIHSSILVWKIQRTVQSMGSQRVGHDWATFTFTFMLFKYLDHWQDLIRYWVMKQVNKFQITKIKGSSLWL